MSTNPKNEETSETDLEQRSRRLRDRLLYEEGFAERFLPPVLDKILGADPKYRQILTTSQPAYKNPCRYFGLSTTFDVQTLDRQAWCDLLDRLNNLPSELLSMILEVAQEIETKS